MNPFPDLPAEQYDALLEDIERRGMVYPVVRDQHGNTIDGHQREMVCATLGIEPHYRVVVVRDDAERDALAIALNTFRRQLSPADRRDAILRLAPTGMTQREIGAAVGVSQRRVGQVLQAEEVRSTSNPDSTGAADDGDPADAPTADVPPALDRQGRPPEARGGRPRNADPTREEVQAALASRAQAIAANPEMAAGERAADLAVVWADAWALMHKAMRRIEPAHIAEMERPDLEDFAVDLADLRRWADALEAAWREAQKPRLVKGGAS